jgi:sugar phosphate permease
MAMRRDTVMSTEKTTTSLTKQALSAERSTSDASTVSGNSQHKFSATEEARLCRKIDWHVVPSVALLYLFCFIDRANVGNAKIAHLDADLHLMGFDYNAILSVFYISYILFEIPSNIVCKLAGPRIWLPTLTLGFGICTISMAFVNNRAQMMGVRFLLGVFEAGMLPGVAYYLSRWYRRDELSFRLGLYIVAAPLAGATGGLLASAIFTIDRIGTVTDWRMLFLVEGIITAGLASIAFFTISDSPESASWLTPAEKVVAQQRVLSERIGSTTVVEKLDVRKVWSGMMNPVVVLTGFIFLLGNVTVFSRVFNKPCAICLLLTTSLLGRWTRLLPPDHSFDHLPTSHSH